jgi:hypothetical protein
MLRINEYDEDEFDYDYDLDKESFYNTIFYITYYKDKNNFLSPVDEQFETDMSNIPVDDDTDDELFKELIKIEHKIDDDVASGKYEGLWVHKISIVINSNYKQIDVDDWSGDSSLESIDVDSVQVDMPNDWTDDDDDFGYLSDYALSNESLMKESIMNMSIRKHYKERINCSEGLECFEIGKRYPDFSMLEPFIINYDVDLNDVEVGDILIRDWQYGHLPNTGYIPMEVIDINNNNSILVQSGKDMHYIANDNGISKDASYHRLDRDYLYE